MAIIKPMLIINPMLINKLDGNNKTNADNKLDGNNIPNTDK